MVSKFSLNRNFSLTILSTRKFTDAQQQQHMLPREDTTCKDEK